MLLLFLIISMPYTIYADYANEVVTFAGTGNHGAEDGEAAGFNMPRSVLSATSGHLVVVDTYNNMIRLVDERGYTTALAGDVFEFDVFRLPLGSNQGGRIDNARFNRPTSGVFDRHGRLYIIDSGNNQIRLLSGENIYSLTGGQVGHMDGDLQTALFNKPEAIAMDGMGNLYVADTLNHSIRFINMETGAVSTLAGMPGRKGMRNGAPNRALFSSPSGIAVSEDGSRVYVADTGNHMIRVIEDGRVSTLAGSFRPVDLEGWDRTTSISGFSDGYDSKFNAPAGIALWEDSLIVADSGNHLIRSVAPDGYTRTIAGNGEAGYRNGLASEVMFHSPEGVYVRENNLYIVDTGNNLIRKMPLVKGYNEGLTPVSFGSDARTARIYRAYGDFTRLSLGNISQTQVEGVILQEGSILLTGRGSSISVQLDERSRLEMDAHSRIVFTQASRNKLSFSLQSGAAFVSTLNQAPGHILEVLIGNRSFTARSASYIINRDDNGVINIYMLGGSIQVDGEELTAGDFLQVNGNYLNRGHINTLRTDDMDAFVIRTLINEGGEILTNEDIRRLEESPGAFAEDMDLIPPPVSAPEPILPPPVIPGLIPNPFVPDSDVLIPPPLFIPEFGEVPIFVVLPEQELIPPVFMIDPSMPFSVPQAPGIATNNIEPGLIPAGSGTAQEPYLISAPWHLEWLAAYENTFVKHFRLITDLQVENITIGTPDAPFLGTFDGGGHTINISIIDTENSYVGLFGQIGIGSLGNFEEGQVKNLNITGNIHAAGEWVGGLVGYNSGKISNVHVAVDISGADNTGGIAGGNRGIIEYSSFTRIVEGSENVGGITGYNNNGIVQNSRVTGRVIGLGNVGGLVGNNSDAMIVNSYAIVDISGSFNAVGGLVGLSKDSIIRGCFSSGTVRGYSRTGGLVGAVIDTGSGISSLENSVSLSRDVSIQSMNAISVGRLIGYSRLSSGVLNDNHASISMTLNQDSFNEISAHNNHHGFSVEGGVYNTKGFWSGFPLNWDFTGVWTWDELMNRPTLRGIN